MPSPLLEPLPYESWVATKETLHLFSQIVGKIALASSPRRNHWWNVTLKPTARGLATDRLVSGDTFFDIAFDFVDHRVDIRTNRAHEPARIPLRDGLSVAEFYAAVESALGGFGIHVPILAKPYGVPAFVTPFAQDDAHHSYDPVMVRRWWNVTLWSSDVIERFAAEFAGKEGPVQLFWHSFDLALGRYSGRRAAGPRSDNPVEREAYSHEVIAFGFWAGDPNLPMPAYYTYTAPEPASLVTMALRPSGATWQPSGSGHMGILPYEAVRTAADSVAALRAFLESGYEAGAAAAQWDTGSFEHTP